MIDNRAGRNGGALSMSYENNNFTIADCVISQNVAAQGGNCFALHATYDRCDSSFCTCMIAVLQGVVFTRFWA